MERGKRKDILPADVTTLVSRTGTDDRQNGAATDGGRFCPCGAWRGTLGLEPTPELYVAHLVGIFREVRRVLRNDGVVFLNLGDSYAATHQGQTGISSSPVFNDPGNAYREHVAIRREHPIPPGLKPKDLCGVPWMVAFALRADGWWLRSAITWCKKSAMPESVEDRPTSATEMVFLLAKSARYFYDHIATREPVSAASNFGQQRPDVPMPSSFGDHRARLGNGSVGSPAGRNMRNYWLLGPEPFAGAHFAVMPTKLVEPCVKAGSSEKGQCPACGAPWARVVERESSGRDGSDVPAGDMDERGIGRHRSARRAGESNGHTVGWRPTCTCPGNLEPVPQLVLDPFAGSGTVGVVALAHGRHFLGIEANPAYVAMARNRIAGDAPLLNLELEVSRDA